uniref:Uncharacterized protein n=1 Tax=Chlamydomonas euryale TaxID=1486919 RepID=A0A7R9VWZ2_9CHLO|mmetsp:Transcript_6479/g.20157  ORF Transcript_6479/g.20157 Transcript_6479/m.20157 type:complete len:264 (+) Transcript_6479:245-1036(+)
MAMARSAAACSGRHPASALLLRCSRQLRGGSCAVDRQAGQVPRHSTAVLRAQPPDGGGGDGGSKYDYSDPVNQFLGNFLPRARDVEAELSHIAWDTPKATGLSLDQMAERLSAALAQKEWFVTGDVEPSLFSDEFAFKDDSVATLGIRNYALGVRKLFDQDTARAELIAVEPDTSRGGVVVTWRLEGRVNLPFRPTIPPYVVTTTLATDAQGLIISQLDEFSVPGWQLLLGALLGAWAGPAPAPPAEQLRQEWQAKRAKSATR